MAKVPRGVKVLPKISIAWVGRTNVTDDKATDGRTTTYSEHELEFTFAKNHGLVAFYDIQSRMKRGYSYNSTGPHGASM